MLRGVETLMPVARKLWQPILVSMPGVFDISEIQSELPDVVAGAKNPFEISDFLRRWN